MENTINSLNRRYATKRFDPNKKLNQNDLDVLLESMRLSPSSFGLQPWKFIHVKNPEVRKQLQEASRGQTQITEASDLIIIASKTEMKESDVDEYIEELKSIRLKGIDINTIPQNELDSLSSHKKMMVDTISSRSPEQLKSRSQKQGYIALGVLLITAASMQIDACPMEGFDPMKYNEILGLDKLGLTATIAIPVGYRSADDKYSKLAKVRFPKEKLVIEVN